MEFILQVCERFGCLPSQFMAEDTEFLRMLQIEAMGKDGGPGG